MSRPLTSGQIQRLQDNPYIVDTLVEIGSYFFTTGDKDVSMSTTTSGGTQTFTAINGLQVIGSIQELYKPSTSTVNLQFGTFDQSFVDDIANTQTVYLNATETSLTRTEHRYYDTDVVIHKLYRNAISTVPDTSNYITLFNGKVSGIDLTLTEDSQVLNIRTSSLFADFNRVISRSSIDFPYANQNEKIYWGYLDRQNQETT